MSKRNAINYIKNDEPAFIKQFKSRVGYQEGPDVDTKRQKLDYEDEDRSDTEEEKPIVVVLKTGDLTAEEADEEDELQKKLEEEQAIREGKFTFKKPVKKGEEKTTEDTADSSTSKSTSKSQSSKDSKKHKDKNKDNKAKKNSSLLSFDDEEEEEDQ